ncbi:MAG TPA: hypothetical protein VMX17_14530 [Candidatus Glassbacteria bacterium]|nr:hypothetical protein [Candidatus Glassbacteria bacterium]
MSTEETVKEVTEEESIKDVKFTPEQQKMLRKMFFQRFPTKHYACRFPGETDRDHKHRMNAKKSERKSRRGK